MAPAAAETRWKAILIAGDSSAPVFDNGVAEVARLLERSGVTIAATFTADPAKVSAELPLATHEELRKLPARVSLAPGEGCLVFATSHGTRRGAAPGRGSRHEDPEPVHPQGDRQRDLR